MIGVSPSSRQRVEKEDHGRSSGAQGEGQRQRGETEEEEWWSGSDIRRMSRHGKVTLARKSPLLR